MSEVVIYHNPRCSKSRQTLELLRNRGYDPRVVEYLKTPLSLDELKRISQQLGKSAREMARGKESQFAELKLESASEEKLFAALADYPSLLERPIVVHAGKARFGRPPEAVLEIL